MGLVKTAAEILAGRKRPSDDDNDEFDERQDAFDRQRAVLQSVAYEMMGMLMRLRRIRGLSLNEVAARGFVPRNNIRNWEEGSFRPTLIGFIQWMRALEVGILMVPGHHWDEAYGLLRERGLLVENETGIVTVDITEPRFTERPAQLSTKTKAW